MSAHEHDATHAAPHLHGDLCATCGKPGQTREYKIDGENFQVLFRALCHSMNLAPTRKSKRASAPFVVRVPDEATHLKLMARLNELAPGLAAALADTTVAYVREKCGVEFRRVLR